MENPKPEVGNNTITGPGFELKVLDDDGVRISLIRCDSGAYKPGNFTNPGGLDSHLNSYTRLCSATPIEGPSWTGFQLIYNGVDEKIADADIGKAIFIATCDSQAYPRGNYNNDAGIGAHRSAYNRLCSALPIGGPGWSGFNIRYDREGMEIEDGNLGKVIFLATCDSDIYSRGFYNNNAGIGAHMSSYNRLCGAEPIDGTGWTGLKLIYDRDGDKIVNEDVGKLVFVLTCNSKFYARGQYNNVGGLSAHISAYNTRCP